MSDLIKFPENKTAEYLDTQATIMAMMVENSICEILPKIRLKDPIHDWIYNTVLKMRIAGVRVITPSVLLYHYQDFEKNKVFSTNDLSKRFLEIFEVPERRFFKRFNNLKKNYEQQIMKKWH